MSRTGLQTQVLGGVYVVGAGRVGRALIRLFREAGIAVVGAWNRSAAAAGETRELTGVEAQWGRPIGPIRGATFIWFTLVDDVIEPMAAEVAREVEGSDLVLLHASGSLGPEGLRRAAPGAAGVAAVHPLQTFAGAPDALQRARQATWFITGDAVGAARAEELMAACGVRTHTLAASQRPLYHAAAALTSNGLVALAAAAARVFERAGFDRSAALSALAPLAQGTLDNLSLLGLPEALTGPVSRGDRSVVAAHCRELAAALPDLLPLYVRLSEIMVEVARDQGRASEAALESIDRLLKECLP